MSRKKKKFGKWQQYKGLATEQDCYVVTTQCVGPERLSERHGPHQPPSQDKSCVCLFYAAGDAELLGPQADTAKGPSALASQKSNPKH